MADKPSDLVQGTLDMLILKTLALDARIWDRRPARTDEQRRFPPQRKFAVCRLPAVATRWPDQERMEGHRE